MHNALVTIEAIAWLMHSLSPEIKNSSILNLLIESQAALGRHQSSVEACAANRKAAIVKFRAKRKQRNFEKKVRYASRQRLAETRPRVRGQFVKADVYAAHRAASREAPTPSPAAAVEACVG